MVIYEFTAEVWTPGKSLEVLLVDSTVRRQGIKDGEMGTKSVGARLLLGYCTMLVLITELIKLTT